jgi:hypothetical protein
MPSSEHLADHASTVITLLSSVGRSRRRQVITALLCFVLPVLFAIPLLQRQQAAWQSSGLQGIPVRKLTISQNVLYAASAEGVFRSEDGEHWQPINTGLPLTIWGGITVHSLAADPKNPALAYALVGDDGDQLALFRTTDTGDHWQEMTTPPDAQLFNTLIC